MLHYQGGEVSPKNTLKRVFQQYQLSLASHLTTSETNQVENNAKTNGKSKTNPFTKRHT